MKVAIVGAGPSGLASARHCIENQIDCTVFEQTGKVGGIWNYHPSYEYDEEGLPLHSVMYKNLLTNQPKELMSYSDYPYPEQTRSYLKQEEVIEYINNYTKHFNILPSVKFYHRVVLIEPNNDKWSVTVENVKAKQQETLTFDVVMVCNGSYRKIFKPEIPGMETFTGKQIHSNIYRTPLGYEGKNVLVIGAGSSGQDIAGKIAEVANRVVLSHKFTAPVRTSAKVVQKNVVRRIVGRKIVFSDDTEEEFDVIVYATGYRYSFPFLSPSCGINVDKRWIKYLYKHIINVSRPTMGFVGMPFMVTHFPMYDLQARFYVAYLLKKFTLPTEEEMMKDITDEAERKPDKGKFHFIGEEQENYAEALATMGGVKKIPKGVHKLFARVRADRNVEDCFKIVDDENFVQLEC